VGGRRHHPHRPPRRRGLSRLAVIFEEHPRRGTAQGPRRGAKPWIKDTEHVGKRVRPRRRHGILSGILSVSQTPDPLCSGLGTGVCGTRQPVSETLRQFIAPRPAGFASEVQPTAASVRRSFPHTVRGGRPGFRGSKIAPPATRPVIGTAPSMGSTPGLRLSGPSAATRPAESRSSTR
jgi:hypothetical protein